MFSKILPWVLTALLSVAAPIVIYDVLSDRGVSDVLALTVSSVGPLLEMGIVAVWRRRLDEFSSVVLVFIVIGIVASLFFDDPRVFLLKESVITGLFGLVMLVTVPTRRPLMFLFGRRFATGGAPARIEWWNGLWQYPGFRRTQRGLTFVWGAAFLVEAIVRGVLTYQLSTETMVVVNAVVPPVVIGLLILVTIVWARRSQKAGEARSAAMGVTVAQAPA